MLRIGVRVSLLAARLVLWTDEVEVVIRPFVAVPLLLSRLIDLHHRFGLELVLRFLIQFVRGVFPGRYLPLLLLVWRSLVLEQPL